MKLKNFLLILIYILISSCSFNDSFNPKLLNDFKMFQTVIENNSENIKDEPFDIADGYHWITESNFENLFSFTTPKFKNRFNKLFKDEEITRIEVWNKKCIRFRIRPNYNNSLLKSEWNELWIIYNSGCDCKCQEIPNEKVELIENNWYKVISKNKRYIGG